MRIGILAVLLLVVCPLADAQTYDLTIQMYGMPFASPSPVATFTGSFTVQNGALTNVNVNDNLTSYGGPFTAGLLNNGQVTLLDNFNGLGFGPGDDVTLSFNVTLVAHPTISDVVFSGDGNSTSTVACQGGTYPLTTVPCTSTIKGAVAGPEVSPSATAIALLAGLLLVIASRRAQSASPGHRANRATYSALRATTERQACASPRPRYPK